MKESKAPITNQKHALVMWSYQVKGRTIYFVSTMVTSYGRGVALKLDLDSLDCIADNLVPYFGIGFLDVDCFH